MINRLAAWCRQVMSDDHWGGRCMVALYLSLLSGVVVALQYDPTHPYFSATSLDILAPFGAFWRALHFYGSQLFFLLAIVHLLAVLAARSHNSLPTNRWLPLSLSMVVALLLLFTGYVLRGDATGSSAGMIAENIVLSIPVLGPFCDSILFSLMDEGMKRVYANHLIGLGLLWLVLAWDHIRRYRISWRQHPLMVLGLVAMAVTVTAPMEPEQLGLFHINGPWFFIGLQELLRYVQPFWAGIVWPTTLLVAMLMLRSGAMEARARRFCLGWLGIYALLTVIGLYR